MVNFKEACKLMREGKKVTRPNWVSGSYWELGPDEMICYADGSHAKVHLEQFNGTDWKIYKEEFYLENKRHMHFGGDYYYEEEEVKKFIKKRINDLHDINNGSITPSQALAKLKMEAGEDLI